MILIAGIGNIFLGDDAFGSEVARRMTARPHREDVRIVDFGIRELDLVYALLDPYDAVILVDATRGGGLPGTLYMIEPEIPEETDEGVQTHEMNPLRVLCVARQMGSTFSNIRIVGCEPADLGSSEEGRIGLSAPVRVAVDEAIVLIESLIQEVPV